MRGFIRFASAAVFTLVLAKTGLAQTARPPARPVKVGITISKQEGNRKTSRPYLVAGSLGTTGQMRIGREVPVTAIEDGKSTTTLQQIGTSVDYIVTPNDDGTFKLQLTITLRSPSGQGDFNNFLSANTLILKDGQTTQYSGSDSAGQAMTVDVTLSVGK